MREGIIIGEFKRLGKMVQTLNDMIIGTMQHVRLGFSGNALHEEALKSLLMKKGLITDTEFKEALGDEIRKANEAQAEVQKKEKEAKNATKEKKTELVKPTVEETSKIDDSKKQ